jgi:hypothetical protein
MEQHLGWRELDDHVDALPERALWRRSLADHVRNGYGFWPVVTIDGLRQVVRFVANGTRWRAEGGVIELLPLHALPVADWPRVRLA